LVKMPPPRRAKIEISEAPKRERDSASTTGGRWARSRRAGQVPEEAGDREQREAGDEHAGDRAGAERDGEAALQAGARGFGGADVGADRDVHADEAGRARQDRADHEAGALRSGRGRRRRGGDDDADDGDRRVLAAQIGALAPSWMAAATSIMRWLPAEARAPGGW
jgi:hypothetical protein